MVHKWLLRKGLRRILAGLILVFVLGPVFFTIVFNTNVPMPIPFGVREWSGYSESQIQSFKNPLGVWVGGIGIILFAVGTVYLLATVILEYMKKRRYAHRSKTYQ